MDKPHLTRITATITTRAHQHPDDHGMWVARAPELPSPRQTQSRKSNQDFKSPLYRMLSLHVSLLHFKCSHSEDLVLQPPSIVYLIMPPPNHQHSSLQCSQDPITDTRALHQQ